MWKLFATLWQPFYFNVQLDLTNACNLRCSHCYHPHHRNKGALTKEQWIEVIQRVQSFSRKMRMTPRLVLCGGEPLLYPHLKEIVLHWETLFPKGPRFILTNGTLLKKPAPIGGRDSDNQGSSYAEWLHQRGFAFQISLDGPDREKHDAIRGFGNFDRTLEGIRHLVRIGASFNVLSVLTRNSSEWIESFFALAQQESFGRMDFERIILKGNAGLNEIGNDLRGADLKEAYQRILAASKSYGVATSTHGPLWNAIQSDLGSSDNLGFYDWIISYKGEMKLSSRTDLILGNVLTDDPMQVLTQAPLLKKLRKAEIPSCAKCLSFLSKKCVGNRNAAFADSGSFLGADPGCWIIASKEKETRHENENRSHPNHIHFGNPVRMVSNG